MSDVRAALAEIATQPEASWPSLVRARWADDPKMIVQALSWLASERARPAEQQAPRRLGDRYQLGVRLGGGATASVWQAYDTKLGRHVAIKVFAAGEASSALVEVLAEARAACDVISDHVVRVLDVHDEAEPAYLVMELVGEHDPQRGELVPGASAAVARPRNVDEAVRWVRDVARGVHDAHLRNVFHRDVKPANVLVTPVSRRARIADFGLAVSTAGDVAAISLVRGALRIAGTPEFMAPEQARGLPIDIDPLGADERATLVAIDVWGLGALAYALLAGRPPWRATAEREPWEVAASGARPAPLAKIPARLRRVIDRAMALEPGERYASAGEVAAELDAYLARRPTTRDRSRVLRAWLWSRRNPQLAVTALVAVALAVGTLAAYLTVVRLRDEGAVLRVELVAQTTERDVLATRSVITRRTLAATEEDLQRQSQALVSLERSVTDAQREYEGIIEAKEQALRDASAATRALVDELAKAHADRDAAQFGRSLYQGYWNAARSDADRAGKERDAATTARAAAEKDRDAAVAARTTAEAELAKLTDEAAAREARLQDLERRLDDARAAEAKAETEAKVEEGELEQVEKQAAAKPDPGASDARAPSAPSAPAKPSPTPAKPPAAASKNIAPSTDAGVPAIAPASLDAGGHPDDERRTPATEGPR